MMCFPVNTRQRGLGIVETMVALLVLSVGMLGIAQLYITSLSSGRTALLRSQAVDLANDMAERIRANRSAKASYDLASYGGAPAVRGCINGPCNRDTLAEDDLARWLVNITGALPGRGVGTPTGNVVHTAVAGGPDRYTISVTWWEAGEAAPGTYTLVLEQ